MYKHWFVQWITCNTDFLSFVHLGGFSFFCLLGLRRWWHQGGGVILSLYNADRESVSMWSIMTDIFLHDAGKIISILVSVSLQWGIFVVSNQNNYPSRFFNIVKNKLLTKNACKIIFVFQSSRTFVFIINIYWSRWIFKL